MWRSGLGPEHCCHIDLRGANVAQSAEPEAALDKLFEGSRERIEELLMGYGFS